MWKWKNTVITNTELENERREYIEKELDYQKKVKYLGEEIQLLEKQTSTLQELLKAKIGFWQHNIRN